MILGVCASIIPFPDHNQVSIELSHLIEANNLFFIVSSKHISERHGKAGDGCVHVEPLGENGHHGSRPVLPLEATRVHPLNGTASFQRAARRL